MTISLFFYSRLTNIFTILLLSLLVLCLRWFFNYSQTVGYFIGPGMSGISNLLNCSRLIDAKYVAVSHVPQQQNPKPPRNFYYIFPLILPPKSCYSRSHACSHVKRMEAYWPINSFVFFSSNKSFCPAAKVCSIRTLLTFFFFLFCRNEHFGSAPEGNWGRGGDHFIKSLI